MSYGRHALMLKDAIRELNPRRSLYDDDPDEVVSDSEPEREAQEQARKRELAYAPASWDYDKPAPLDPSRVKSPTPQPPKATAATEVIVIDDDDDDMASRMREKLAKFKMPSAPLSRKPSATSASIAKGPSASTSSLQSLANDTWQLMTVEFAKVNTCPGCDTRWTSRKTAAQKISHIRTCTRKRGMAEDTIRTLLRAQVDGTVTSNLPSVLGPSAKAQPATYLESIVNETKKKAGRVAHSSVLPVDKARDDILARGSAVLRIDKSNQDLVPPSSAKGSPLRAFSSYDENYPATQALPTSRLATVSSLGVLRRTSGASSDEEDESEDLPLATQAFAPSKFALAASTSTRALGASAASPRRPRSRSRSPTIVISSSDTSPAPSSPRTRGRPRSPASREAAGSSSGTEPDLDPWAADDAVFEGGADSDDDAAGGMVRRYSEQQRADVRRYSSLLAPPLEEVERSPSPSPGPKKKGRPKKIANALATSSREEPTRIAVPSLDFAGVMRDCILSNKQLHERILRYEPIHFDVFAKLALDYGFEKRTLFTKLRTFLDQEAINFHTNQPDAPSSRRRRRR
ncbi:hypothetical protein EXIGLDRAFT_828049 [Exidia glandulosa HHB12029]|uniref:Structure-specific endonuclease subunit SLX4 n=1 Tax=Exidia glandulosa HHB12029 TaxID=1314781 RepID=A0A165QVC5_EXIGL|nr:hypothetical protein EXIGLDRAFT_828049 [Exidia glandulosa HHB12029]